MMKAVRALATGNWMTQALNVIVLWLWQTS
ncbi:hypothetical protein THIOSC15_3450012 [uncultured Thiomicrorhabdus sp.]